MSWDHNNNNTTTIAITEAAAAAAVAAAATTRGVHSFQWGFTVPIHCYCGRDLCVDCVDNTNTCNKLYRMMTITQFNSRGRQKIVNRPFTYKEKPLLVLPINARHQCLIYLEALNTNKPPKFLHQKTLYIISDLALSLQCLFS